MKTVSVGDQIGHYTVSALLGEGGMGQVWQATDSQLHREVALKLLPAVFSANEDRLARFRREAKVLASLNHPGIGAIYGLEHSGGTQALVLELVEGPTLADRIARGAVPVDEALAIARQIAEALEVAHEAGIVHRDLKPANIKVRPDGAVKVLDFGLAKALGGDASVSTDESPTITAVATQMGVIVGTAAYMSPEQARGSTVDRRADIWAFGTVLYELLTGRALFNAPTVTDTLAAVLRHEIDWTTLPTSLPEPVERLLRRCLDRDPRSRLRDIGEARVALDEAKAAPAGAKQPIASPPRSSTDAWRAVVPWLGGAAAGALVAGLILSTMTTVEPALVSRYTVSLPSDAPLAPGPGSSLALSPDGRRLAFVALARQERSGGLYLQDFSALEPTLVPGSSGARTPFFSPDGEWVAFVAENALQRVSTRGGKPTVIAEAAGMASGGSWSPDGSIVFTVRNGGLLRVAADGGTPEPLTTVDTGAGIQDHLWPDVTPDGRAVIFTVWSGSLETAQVAALSLTGGTSSTLVGGSTARYVPTGHLVFARDGALWAAPFDLDALAMAGPEVQMVPDVVTMTGGGAAHFAVSDSGTLAYLRGGIRSTAAHLKWVDRQGAFEPLPIEPRAFSGARLSPDGRQVAFTEQGGGEDANSDIWLGNVNRGDLRRLTTDPALDRDPLWSPDSDQIAFSSLREGSWGIYRQDAAGTGDDERLAIIDGASYVRPESWSADGTHLFFEFGSADDSDIGLLDLSDRTWIALLQTDAKEREPQISPDGRWVAYSSNALGDYRIFVQPFPGPGTRQQVSSGIGWQPLWSSDGRELFYVGAESTLYTVPVELGSDAVAVGDPAPLFQWDYLSFTGFPERQWDVHPSSGRFLMYDAPGLSVSNFTMIVVDNWFEELVRHAPVD